MSIESLIKDGDGSGLNAKVIRKNSTNGIIAYTSDLDELEIEFPFLLNETFGADMNQAVTFGGTGLAATVIHAGVNSGNGESGTTSGTTADKLVDAGQDFETTVGPGAVVHNTTDDTYATVTAVDSDTVLSIDSDIMESGEAFTINPIWVGTAVAGTWNFADSTKITITNANDSDEATFTVDASHVWDAQYFTTLTGKVDLDTYNSTVNSMTLEFGLNGVLVGNSVILDDYVDTTSFAEQSFSVPKEDFGLSTQTFNSMRLTISRSGGGKPTIKFDDFQWESSGTPLVFNYHPKAGERIKVLGVRIVFVDNVTTANAQDYNALLGVGALSNGIGVSWTSKGIAIFNGSITKMIDFVQFAGADFDVRGDGSNTWVTVNYDLASTPVDMIIGDEFKYTINDDLSALILFRVLLRVAKVSIQV